MPRKKLSEFKSKTIINQALGLSYEGWSINSGKPSKDQFQGIADNKKYVVKVDEGVKGRFKKGLVKLDVSGSQVPGVIEELTAIGFTYFIIENMVNHDTNSERYLSLVLARDGINLSYSKSGGINIEDNQETINSVIISDSTNWTELERETSIKTKHLKQLVAVFKENFFSFLEINPYITNGDSMRVLDAAVEVDDAGAYFIKSWTQADFRTYRTSTVTDEELVIEDLDTNSPASFNLSVLNPNGGIFLLLSGGGASVVVADEIFNQGYGKELANYGEYSGNPNEEETFIYTKELLELLLKSNSPKKVLFVGGAVANFTDIKKTFKGVVKAIESCADELKKQNVKVFVRRGGPNQQAGLKLMKETLSKNNLLGAVHSPDTPITDVVGEALREFKK
jgi:ATP-citrate lyase beta-subunit